MRRIGELDDPNVALPRQADAFSTRLALQVAHAPMHNGVRDEGVLRAGCGGAEDEGVV